MTINSVNPLPAYTPPASTEPTDIQPPAPPEPLGEPDTFELSSEAQQRMHHRKRLTRETELGTYSPQQVYKKLANHIGPIEAKLEAMQEARDTTPVPPAIGPPPDLDATS